MSTPNSINPNLHIEDISSYGMDNGNGNLIAIQPFMEVGDYASAEHFSTKLDGYLQEVQAQYWLCAKSIVIFPEYIGTWLVAVGEDDAIFQADSLETAVKQMIRTNLIKFTKTLLHTKSRNKIIDAIFRMKAKEMAHIYQETFSQLAQNYQVTVVAGSIVLPEPQIVDGELVVGNGRLQNISIVCKPDGTLHPHIIRKIFPVHLETTFLDAAQPTELPNFDTPAGKLGVLICADSWYPEAYAPLAEQNVELIVVPNNQGNWHHSWPGYATEYIPADVDLQDVMHLTEKEAWLKYALAGRMRSTSATIGIHVFLHGRIWDQIGDGQTIIVHNEGLITAPYVSRAALVNVWLD